MWLEPHLGQMDLDNVLHSTHFENQSHINLVLDNTHENIIICNLRLSQSCYVCTLREEKFISSFQVLMSI